VAFAGNLAAQPIRFGVPYDSRHRLSTIYQRSQDGKAVEEDGRLQVIGLSVTYTRTAYFRVEVTCEGRVKRTYTFNGRVISNGDNKTGVLVLDDGRFLFPVMFRNDRVIIELVNDTWLRAPSFPRSGAALGTHQHDSNNRNWRYIFVNPCTIVRAPQRASFQRDLDQPSPATAK
jgi:hypothetical protein